MPECRWCFKKATAWIRDVGQEPPGYAVCDWHADQSKRLGWRVFRPQFPEPCENCGKVWENGDCFTTPARTVRCALIRHNKIIEQAAAVALPEETPQCVNERSC